MLSSKKFTGNDPAQDRFRQRQSTLTSYPATRKNTSSCSVGVSKPKVKRPTELVLFPEWEQLFDKLKDHLPSWVWHWTQNTKFLRFVTGKYVDCVPQDLSLTAFIHQRTDEFIRQLYTDGPTVGADGSPKSYSKIYKWAHMSHNSVAGHLKKRISKASRAIVKELDVLTSPRIQTEVLWYGSRDARTRFSGEDC